MIFADNQGAISLADNPSAHGKSKQIEVRHHFIRNAVSDGVVTLTYMPTDQQAADELTKPLGRETFKRLVRFLG